MTMTRGQNFTSVKAPRGIRFFCEGGTRMGRAQDQSRDSSTTMSRWSVKNSNCFGHNQWLKRKSAAAQSTGGARGQQAIFEKTGQTGKKILLVAWVVLVSLKGGYSAGQESRVQYPLALAVTEEGGLFVADRNLPGIWQLEGDSVELFFAASKQFRTPLNAVRCLAIDRQDQLLAGDSATRQVYRFNDQGQPEPLARPLGALKLGPLGIPMSVAVNEANEIFVSDLEFHCIWKIPPQGGEPVKFVELQAPIGICVDDDDHLWVVSRLDGQLRRYAPDGTEQVIVEGRPFDFPHNVAVDAQGRAYVVDGYGRAVWRVTPGEEPEKWFQDERLVNPVDLKRSGEDLLLIDPRAKAIFRIAPDGSATVTDL
jgi:streptogramin lyase